jgi:hypothetical protein
MRLTGSSASHFFIAHFTNNRYGIVSLPYSSQQQSILSDLTQIQLLHHLCSAGSGLIDEEAYFFIRRLIESR